MNFFKTLMLAFVVIALSAIHLVRAQAPDEDPPSRVARLGEMIGQVWYYSPDNGDWIAAVRNQPITGGDRIATDVGARAELQLGSTILRLDSSTELEVTRLDDTQFATHLLNGSAALRIRDAVSTGQFTLSTDEGRFVITSAGAYRFDRSDRNENLQSAVTVTSGQARYEGQNSALTIGAGERTEFWIDSHGVAQYNITAPVYDAFAAWNNERDRPVPMPVAERYVSPEMTGADDLDRYGRWEQSPDYGPLWIPATVPFGWAPYSSGHWAWVQPWGWTWIDDAPWGFAPFHYGRWVYVRDNWCWTPGQRAVRPVYAPALVGWIGGPRVAVGISFGSERGGPPVGWFPLAPREVYVPSHPVSPRYIREVNITNVTNVTVINNVIANPQAPREFDNRRFPHAVTIVPSSVMTGHQPVGPAAAQVRQQPWARDFATQPNRGAALLAPPVDRPATPIQRPDQRAVRPPLGAMPDAGGRTFSRPESPVREGSRESDGRLPNAQLGVMAAPMNPGAQKARPAVVPAPPSAARPAAENPGSIDGARGVPRGADDRRGENNRDNSRDSGRSNGRTDGVPAVPRGEPAPPGRAAPGAQMPSPMSGAARSVAPLEQAAQPSQSPTMRTMPIRDEERRPVERPPGATVPAEGAQPARSARVLQEAPRVQEPSRPAPGTSTQQPATGSK